MDFVAQIYFHAKMDSFFKHVPKEMCPEEYGGGGGSLKDISGKYNCSKIISLKKHSQI
jgi:hypothetical protein